MKKVFIISTILLTLFTSSIPNVYAEDAKTDAVCQVKLDDIPAELDKSLIQNIGFNLGGRQFSGNVYIATLSSGSITRIALCLDKGKHAANKYIRSTSNVTITQRMRKAYQLAKEAYNGGMTGSANAVNNFKYYTAQAIIWAEMEGYSFSLNHINSMITTMISNYWSGTTTPTDVIASQIEQVQNAWMNVGVYSGELYVYESVTSPDSYQRFLADLSITECSGNPNSSCSGGVVKVTGTPAVCSNDNNIHTGQFYEYVDMSECGDADKDFGQLVRKFGDFAGIYCLESVTQSYPGGISSPISLGTSLVWPTSDKTKQTVWGNLYPLTYRGTKACVIKYMKGKDPKATFNSYIATLNSLARYDEKIRSVDGCKYSSELTAAQQSVDNAKQKVTDAETALNNRRSSMESCNNRNANVSKHNDQVQSCRTRNPNHPEDCGEIWTTESCGDTTTEEQNVATAKAALTVAEGKYQAVQNNIQQCNTYRDTYQKALSILNNNIQVATVSFGEKDFYNFENSVSVSYNDPEYGTTYTLQSTTNYTCNGCTGLEISGKYTIANTSRGTLSSIFNRLYSNITNRKIVIEATTTYRLPDGLYHYVDKKTNKSLMTPPTGDYITIGYSNLPTSYKAKTNKKYNLTISVNSLGEDGKFTELANSQPYVCNYSVTNAPSDECVCPDGTKHAGEDLYCKILNASKTETTMTCADARELYCDSNETFDEYCTDDKFCPNDKSIKITSCLNNGFSYQYCVDNICSLSPNPSDDDYHCPKGTWNDGMDIKPCVFANIDMGLEAALQYCKDTVCPYKGGINIIYRTISLRNPFPGKKATGLTRDFSLDNLQGRFPGANWNSKTLVKSQILYNRGVEGNEVYTRKPLYTFILDTPTIKDIREYNDSREASGGYADFTLDCNSSGVACLSNKFLRESNSGLVSGVCSAGTKSTFYTCSESSES